MNTDTRPSGKLRAALHGWRERLPVSWATHFSGVELAFDEFDIRSSAKRPLEFWPAEARNAPALTRSPFKPLHDLSPDMVRVVIVGRDPYSKKAQATGRSFEQGDLCDWAVAFARRGPISTSLRHIAIAAAACSKKDRANSVAVADRPALRSALLKGRSGLSPPDCCFGEWAKQGVLWLNRAATFSSESDQTAHRELWKPFTDQLLRVLAHESRKRRVVIALWGDYAQELASHSWRKSAGEELRIITSAHPSAPGVAFLASGNPLVQINDELDPEHRIVWNASAG